MKRALARARALHAARAHHTPYVLEQVGQAVSELTAAKAPAALAPALDRLERALAAAEQGRGRFEQQLAAHLEAIRQLVSAAVEERWLSPQHCALVEPKLRALQESAATESHAQIAQRARALEQALARTIHDARAARLQMRRAALLSC